MVGLPLPHWPQCTPSPLSGGKGDTGVPGKGKKAIATANLQIELPEFQRKTMPEWADQVSAFLLLTGQQHAAFGAWGLPPGEHNTKAA